MSAAVYCQEAASSVFQQDAERQPSTEKGTVLSCKAPWAQARWAEQIWWQEQEPSYKRKVTKDLRSTKEAQSARQECWGTSWTQVYLQYGTSRYQGMMLSWNGAARPKGRGVVQVQVRLFRAVRACHCAQGPYIYCILQYAVVLKKYFFST